MGATVIVLGQLDGDDDSPREQLHGWEADEHGQIKERKPKANSSAALMPGQCAALKASITAAEIRPRLDTLWPLATAHWRIA